jgi:hypothetical protein
MENVPNDDGAAKDQNTGEFRVVDPSDADERQPASGATTDPGLWPRLLRRTDGPAAEPAANPASDRTADAADRTADAAEGDADAPDGDGGPRPTRAMPRSDETLSFFDQVAGSPSSSADEPTVELQLIAAGRRSGGARRAVRAGSLALVLVLLAAAGVTVVSLVQRAGRDANAAGDPGSAGPAPGRAQEGRPTGARDGDVLTVPVNGRGRVRFDLVDGAASIRMRIADLGDDLFRVAVPPQSSVSPRADDRGEGVRLFLPPSGGSNTGTVDIILNEAVRWDLRVGGGVDRGVIDLSGGKVTAVDLAGGGTAIQLTLPSPEGVVPVTMSGGVNQFVVKVPDPTSVRVHVAAGAGSVVVGGHTYNGIAPGAFFTPPNWAKTPDRIDLDAIAGMAALHVQ